MSLTIGSLFSGYGGLDCGVQQAIGGDVIWHSDIKPAAVKLLAYRYPDIPNLGDITAVDWDSVERPDVLTGGFPCTDISAAGKQAGLIRYGDGKTRSGLWAEMCRAINTLRPSLVVAENVRAITSVKADSDVEPCPWCLGDGPEPSMRALGAVLADLADIGYDAAWCGLRAADIGAPHGRFRIFICAWPADPDTFAVGRRAAWGDDGVRAEGLVEESVACTGSEPWLQRGVTTPRQASAWQSLGEFAGRGGTPAADTARVGRNEGWPEPAGLLGGPDAAVGGAPIAADPIGGGRDGRAPDPLGGPRDGAAAARGGAEAGSRPAAPDTLSGGQQWGPARLGGTPAPPPRSSDHDGINWGPYGDAVHRWELTLGRLAPAPTEATRTGTQRLSPAFAEWMMNLPDGHVTDVPGLTRNEQLSLLGDGVVPGQAAEALRRLLPVVGMAVAA